MKISEIVKILDGTVMTGENRLEENNDYVFATDLMSEVLTLGDKNPIILSGLCNMQTIRTCEMGNLDILIIVRGKKPTDDMMELAEENGMVVIACGYSMFKACGLLYQNGLKPLY